MCLGTPEARPHAECTRPPHWLWVQHLAGKIENLPVAGTKTQPGSHETSLGNLEHCAPCPSTVLLKHHLFHEAAPPFPLPHCSQTFDLHVVTDLSESACLHQGTHLQLPRLQERGVQGYPHTAQHPSPHFKRSSLGQREPNSYIWCSFST